MENGTGDRENIRAFIGIDPGASGGIAMITVDHLWYAERFPIDKSPYKAKQIFNHMVLTSKNEGFLVDIYLERVHAMPTDGRSSAFKFGMNYGMWFGITANYELNLVTPQKWQSHYGELPKDKTLKKRKLKEIATEMVNNDVKPTLCTSDAILIANYGKEITIEK